MVAANVTPNRMRTAMRIASDRYHLQNLPESFADFAELLLTHDTICKTLDRQDSVFMTAVGPPGHVSIILLSRRVHEHLSEVEIVFSDGTFASRPSRPRSAQVFLITTMFGNTVCI